MRSRILVEKIRIKSKNHCWYCGKYLPLNPHDKNNGKEASTIGHIVPLRYGGNDDINNLVLCCKSCNSIKREDSLDIFRCRMTYKINDIPPFNKEQLDYLNKYDFKFPLPNGIYKFYFEEKKLQP